MTVMELKSLPLGFRFHPTDEELIRHYLKGKITGQINAEVEVIPEIDVCKCEPWDLPGTPPLLVPPSPLRSPRSRFFSGCFVGISLWFSEVLSGEDFSSCYSGSQFFIRIRLRLVSNLGPGFVRCCQTSLIPRVFAVSLDWNRAISVPIPAMRFPFSVFPSPTYSANLPAAGFRCSEKLSRLPAAAYSVRLGDCLRQLFS